MPRTSATLFIVMYLGSRFGVGRAVEKDNEAHDGKMTPSTVNLKFFRKGRGCVSWSDRCYCVVGGRVAGVTIIARAHTHTHTHTRTRTHTPSNSKEA